MTSPGRLEIVRRSPTVVLDAAHNPAGARATAEAVGEAFDFSRLIGVVGASGDKDDEGLLEAFEPVFAEVVITQNSSHRAMDADELAAIAVEIFGEDRVQVEPRLDDAIEAAITLAEEEGEFRAAACSSPAPSSPSARPGCCWGGADSVRTLCASTLIGEASSWASRAWSL